MDSEVKLFMQRAADEFLLAQTEMRMSQDTEVKEKLGIPSDKTFYHAVISHAYYSIFNAAKAYLRKKDIITNPPGEHQKTYESFKKFVQDGTLDKELLNIYENELMKASSLLHLFKKEKKKRGKFTYNIKSQANIPYAQESLESSRTFLATIQALL